MPLLGGELSVDELRTRLEARAADGSFTGSVAEAVELAREVQKLATQQRLRPSLRTHYLRTAFQREGDASVRISLDTDLCMSASRGLDMGTSGLCSPPPVPAIEPNQFLRSQAPRSLCISLCNSQARRSAVRTNGSARDRSPRSRR